MGCSPERTTASAGTVRPLPLRCQALSSAREKTVACDSEKSSRRAGGADLDLPKRTPLAFGRIQICRHRRDSPFGQNRIWEIAATVRLGRTESVETRDITGLDRFGSRRSQ